MRTAPGESVLGVGVDLVEVGRVRLALERWRGRFCARVFRDAEQAYCDSRAAPWRHYAARFAVKEAVGKAFGTGIGADIGWLDIEVRRVPETGAPEVVLTGKAAALARRRGVRRVLASLSHARDYAIAQVVLSGRRAAS